MKVGTDGVLLGAWAEGGRHILDIGTGTGVIALMMAQRFPDSQVTAIDIDESAVLQAHENIVASPFHDRVEVLHTSIQDFPHHSQLSLRESPIINYQLSIINSIISNPPFFIDSLRAPDQQRSTARHTDTLTYEELMQSATRLLSDDGVVSVIVPFDYRCRMDDAAVFAGLFPSRVCAVTTKEGKSPRRYLLAYRKHPCLCHHEQLTIGSPTYHALTHDFYL